MSGLDAGMIYQTWPKMGNSYFPDDISFNKVENYFDFDNHSLVQFYHRNLAYFIIIYSLFLSFKVFKNKRKKSLSSNKNIIIIFINSNNFWHINIGKWTKHLFSLYSPNTRRVISIKCNKSLLF